MKLTLPVSHLLAALTDANGCVESRPTLPVLSHVYIAANAETYDVTVAATNLEQFIYVNVGGATVEESGAWTVPAQLMLDFVKTLPKDESCTLELSKNTLGALNISCGKAEADIKGISADEFPMRPSVFENGNTIARFSASDLLNNLKRVAYAAATDESRPVQTGVYIKSEEGTLSLCTADGYRLALIEKETNQPEGQFILPASTAKELLKLLGDLDGEVTLDLAVQANAVLWRLGYCDLVSQLIEGKYVNYRQIVPGLNTHKTRITVDRNELTRALNTAKLFGKEYSKGKQPFALVLFDLAPLEGYEEGTLRISATSVELGDYETALRVGVDGEANFRSAFNTYFVLDAVKACGTDRVVFEFTEGTRPAVVKPDGDDTYTCVIMPMHRRED